MAVEAAETTVPLELLVFDEADRLRRALRISGTSVGEMAEYLGLKPETCSRYINGRAEAKVQTLRLWAMKTGVPFEWLKTGKAPRPDADEGPSEFLLPHLDSNQKPADYEPPAVRARDLTRPPDNRPRSLLLRACRPVPNRRRSAVR